MCRVLKTSDGGGIALSNFEGKKPVVLFFYPKGELLQPKAHDWDMQCYKLGAIQ